MKNRLLALAAMALLTIGVHGASDTIGNFITTNTSSGVIQGTDHELLGASNSVSYAYSLTSVANYVKSYLDLQDSTEVATTLEDYVAADGSVPFTDDQSFGDNEATNIAGTFSSGNFVATIEDDDYAWAIYHGDAAYSSFRVTVSASGNTIARVHGAGVRNNTDTDDYWQLQPTANGVGITAPKGLVIGDQNVRLGKLDAQAPQYPFQLGTNAPWSSNPVGPALTKKYSGASSGNLHGFISNLELGFSSGGHAFNDFDAYDKLTGDDTYDHHAGYQYRLEYSGAGSIDYVYAYWALPVFNGGGAVGEYYGMKLYQPSLSGGTTVGSIVNMDLGAATSGTDTNLSLRVRGKSEFLDGIEASGAAMTLASLELGGSDVAETFGTKSPIFEDSDTLAGLLDDETGVGGGFMRSNAPTAYAMTVVGGLSVSGGISGDGFNAANGYLTNVIVEKSIKFKGVELTALTQVTNVVPDFTLAPVQYISWTNDIAVPHVTNAAEGLQIWLEVTNSTYGRQVWIDDAFWASGFDTGTPWHTNYIPPNTRQKILLQARSASNADVDVTMGNATGWSK